MKQECQDMLQNPQIGRFVRECVKRRDYLGWTQADVATRTGVSRSCIANFEAEIGNVSLATAARLARCLGINLHMALWSQEPEVLVKIERVEE